LSVIVNAPRNCLTVVGVKITLNVQLVFAAREGGQLLVSPKLLLSTPVMDAPEINRGAFPVLVSVTIVGPLDVLMFWSAKDTGVGENTGIGAAIILSVRAELWVRSPAVPVAVIV